MRLKQSSFVDHDYTLSLAHSHAYLNLDAIIASSERTTCRLRVNLPSLAPLLISDSGLDTRLSRKRNSAAVDVDDDGEEEQETRASMDIPAGTKLELPAWLALSIAMERRQLVTIDLPPIYKTRLKIIMDAALNASRQDTLPSTAKFENLEMALFRVGQSERLQLERWISRHHHKIEPTAFLKSINERAKSKRPRPLIDQN